MNGAADPERTYALVVGIEKYKAGGEWNTLDGPASDARRFADWLCTRGVPAKNISLFLSPLDENGALIKHPGSKVLLATQQEISSTLTDVLPQKEGDLLYLFWGGHGVITAEGKRRLFYADATQESKRNLDLDSLLMYLRSTSFAGFAQQIFFIDTCANYVVDPLLPNLGGEFFPVGPPRRNNEQFVLLAAKEGERAINMNARHTGLFSELVMEILTKEADNKWPPSMEKLAADLENRFRELRKDRGTQQTPTYFWYRDRDGRVGTLGSLQRDQRLLESLIAGLSRLQTDYSASVKNFLDSYLGIPGQPVPFGGREGKLAQLDEWLDEDSAPHYLLLTAPAARGKSALLTYWTQRLLARDNIDVVFVPISIRFGTNLPKVYLPVLATRLAEVYSEPSIPSIVDASAEAWRGAVMNFLSLSLPEGHRLVVILDGADESAGLESLRNLFPVRPPSGLRVVISARRLAGDADARPWLVRLGWESPARRAKTMDLKTLSSKGIADVLHHMGFPLSQLSKKIDVVDELYRLSKGDPLLVRFYVDDLWAKGEEASRLQPEDLNAIRPGLEGYLEDYFKRWEQEQESLWGKETPLALQKVQTILNILSCAMGPLHLDDIYHLAPNHISLSSHDITGALSHLRRLVIGDGHKQGYVFSHYLLNVYFYEKLGKQERELYESRFLEWGKEVLSDLNGETLPQTSVPPYLVQYYGAHLKRNEAVPEAFLALVSNGWFKAWEALSGDYAGFHNDVEQAWEAVERANKRAIETGQMPQYIGEEVRCALCNASITSMTTNIPAELIRALVEQKVLTPKQALIYVCRDSEGFLESWNRSTALRYLAPFLDDEELQQFVLAWVQTITEEREQVNVLEAVIEKLSPQLLSKALSIARKFVERENKVTLLVRVAQQMYGSQKEAIVEEALEVTREIISGYDWMWAITKLAPLLSEEIILEQLDKVRSFASSLFRVRALLNLAAHLPDPKKGEVLEEAWKTGLSSVDDPVGRAESLTLLAYQLSDSNRDEAIKEALAAWKHLFTLSSHLANTWQIIHMLIPLLSEASVRDVLELVRTTEDDYQRAVAMESLAYSLPEPDRKQVLYEALKIARTIGYESSRMLAIKSVAYAIAHIGYIDEALTIAQSIELAGDRAEARAKLAPFLSKTMLLEVFADMRPIRDEEARARALGIIATRLSEPYSEPIFAKAIETARHIQSPVDHAVILEKLATLTKEPLTGTYLCEALMVAQTIPGASDKARILSELLPQVAAIGEVQKALTVARNIDDAPYLKVKVVAKVATYLQEPERGDVVREVIRAILVLEDPDWVIEKIISSVDKLGHVEELLKLVLSVSCIMSTKARMVKQLAPHMSKELLQEKLETLPRSKNNNLIRANLMIALASKTDETSRDDLLSSALESLQGIRSAETRAEALIELMPHFEGNLRTMALKAALKAALNIRYVDTQAEVLSKIVPNLSEPLRSKSIAKAIQAAQTIPDKERRIMRLTKLASYLPAPLLEEIVRDIKVLDLPRSQASTLVALAPYYPRSLQHQLLQAAKGIETALARAEAFAGMLPHLLEPGKNQAIRETIENVSAIDSFGYRLPVLEALLPALISLPASELYPLWRKLLRSSVRYTRKALLSDLGALLSIAATLGKEEAVMQIAQVIVEIGQQWL